MAWAQVQGTGVESVGSVASVAKAFASNVTAGNTIIVAGCAFGTGKFPTNAVTDSLSNSYTRDVTVNGPTPSNTTAIFSAFNIAGGACTVTLDATGSDFQTIGIMEASGGGATPTAETTATVSTNTATPATGNLVTTDTDLIVGAITYDGASQVTINIGGTYTQNFEDESYTNQPMNMEYKVVASGTYTANWDFASTSRAACGAAVAYKPTAASTAPFPPWPPIIRPLIQL